MAVKPIIFVAPVPISMGRPCSYCFSLCILTYRAGALSGSILVTCGSFGCSPCTIIMILSFLSRASLCFARMRVGEIIIRCPGVRVHMLMFIHRPGEGDQADHHDQGQRRRRQLFLPKFLHKDPSIDAPVRGEIKRDKIPLYTIPDKWSAIMNKL